MTNLGREGPPRLKMNTIQSIGVLRVKGADLLRTTQTSASNQARNTLRQMMQSFMAVQVIHFMELTIHFVRVKFDKVVQPPLGLRQGLETSTIANMIRSPVTALQVEVGRDLEDKLKIVHLDLELRIPHLRSSIALRRR